MISTAELIAQLRSLDVQIWSEGGRLRLSAPQGVLTSVLREELSRRKGEIVDLLKVEPEAGPPASRLPRIEPAPRDRHLPFPLTDLQQAYWIGRRGDFELGNVAPHFYLELDFEALDVERLETVLSRLIARHDMLRVIVGEDGFQQILPEVPRYAIELADLRGLPPAEADARLGELRDRLSHQVLPTDRWPLFEIRASRLPDGRTRLHLSLDLMIGDAWSFQIFFGELFRLYADPVAELPVLELSFRDYVLAQSALRGTERYRQAEEYWQRRLANLPGSPQLPLAKSPGTIAQPVFTRHLGRLEPARWSALKAAARRQGLTPSGLLLAAFSDVLATWCKSPRFALNLTLFNRLPLHPQVNDIMGDFSATVLLVVDASARTFRQRAQALQQQLWRDLEYSYVSGVKVLRQLTRRSGDAAVARMPVVFTSTLGQEGQKPAEGASLLTAESVYSISQTPQVWLDHRVMEEGGALGFNWDAVEDLFPAGLLDEMFAAYCGLLERLAGGEEAWEEPPLSLVPARHLALVESINATSAPLPSGLLHAGFLERAASAPERPAVIAGPRMLSYGELAARSRHLAHRLRELSVRPNELVAVVMEKGWEQVVGVLGVLESGAAYLPVEAGVPSERLRQLLALGEVRVAVTQPELLSYLDWPDGIERLAVADGPVPELAPLAPAQSPLDLAYVIFTSGSTGQPKGVMIEHRSALNTIADLNRRFQVGPEDRVLALSSLSFDLSVYDVFGLLAAGGAVVMPEPWAAREPGRWQELMAQHGVTVWDSVPALFDVLVDWAESRGTALAPSLRLALLSGDWIPASLPDRARRLGGVEVVSLGGATEGAIWSIFYRIGTVPPEWKSIPYGGPLDNQRMYVLNEALEPCPAWVPGDLYIGGEGVARGYWRDEERTASSFLVHPRTGERLYRTGDLGRWLPEGTIELLGREDFQVKVQGYRIELGEIESVLSQHASVRSCVVSAVGESQGSKRLVAYVVSEPGEEGVAESLRSYLSGKLPGYMVPSSFVFLEALPLSSTGKVDRRALPPPPANAGPAPTRPAGEPSPMAESIARIVERVLGSERVEPDDNLLDLGASSVDLIRIANQLERELSFRPKMEEVFRAPTVNGLAGLYARQAAQAIPVEAGAPSRWAPGALVIDPEERERFKERRLHLRPAEPERQSFDLPLAEHALGFPELRSERLFAAEPIPAESLGAFLAGFRELAAGGHTRRLYPSAGGLYPVQVYLHLKKGRVEGLPHGTYYYDPEGHSLVALTLGVDLDPGIHADFINRPIFERAAFSLFLIAQAGAIAPLYGKRSRDFCLLEAGAMLQLLRATAPEHGLGICPIGGLDFDSIHPLFALDENHELMHSLVGGMLPAGGPPSARQPSAASVGVWEEGRRGRDAAAEPLLRIPRDGELPLSSPQLRLWFIDQLEPGNPAYNVFGAVRASGPLDAGALARAVSEIVRRHEVLRATFPAVDGQPRQIIATAGPVTLPVVDLRGLGSAVREAEVERLAWAEAARPFDLAAGPLLRASLVDLGGEERLVLFTMHHIVSDAWSRGILVTELVPLYMAFAEGRPSPLPELPVQYVDFAAWQRSWLRGAVLDEQLAYWKRQLGGSPGRIDLPTRRLRAEEVSARGSRFFFALPAELRDGLVSLARQLDASLFMVLLAGFQALLHLHSGQDDIAVGTPITNRRRAETEGLIGFFVNTLVMRTELAGDPTVGELIVRVREVVLGAFTHQDTPFELVVDALRPERRLSRTPLFQVWFVLQNVPSPAVELPGVRMRGVDLHSGLVRHDLKLELAETPDGIRGYFEYKTDLFEEATIQRFAADLEALLRLAVARPEAPLSELVAAVSEAWAARQRAQEEELLKARRQRLTGLRRRPEGSCEKEGLE